MRKRWTPCTCDESRWRAAVYAALARDKPEQDAIDRPRAFDYNAGAAAACLDGIAAREVVGMRCEMQESMSLEDRNHGRCADVA